MRIKFPKGHKSCAARRILPPDQDVFSTGESLSREESVFRPRILGENLWMNPCASDLNLRRVQQHSVSFPETCSGYDFLNAKEGHVARSIPQHERTADQ